MSKVCIVTSPDLDGVARKAIADCQKVLEEAGTASHLVADELVGSEAGRKAVHDLKEAVMTMEHVIRDLEGGYQFNDDFAGEKIKMIAKSVASLNHATEKLIHWLRG